MPIMVDVNSTLNSSISQNLKVNELKQQQLRDLKERLAISNEDIADRERFLHIQELMEDENFWTTEKFDIYDELVESGEINNYRNVKTPYFDNQYGLKKSGLDFGYTENEVLEFKKCARDIIHFAENYCYTMTPQGYKLIRLRPYQKRVLTEMVENKFICFLASRQIGKCCLGSTYIQTSDEGKKSFHSIYYDKIKKIRKLTLFERIKCTLYDMYNRLDK